MPGRSSVVLRKLIEPTERIIIASPPLEFYLGGVSSSVGCYIGYRDHRDYGFALSPSVPPENAEIEPRLGYDRFIQNHSQFIIHT
jgi:hypothetical protein